MYPIWNVYTINFFKNFFVHKNCENRLSSNIYILFGSNLQNTQTQRNLVYLIISINRWFIDILQININNRVWSYLYQLSFAISIYTKKISTGFLSVPQYPKFDYTM